MIKRRSFTSSTRFFGSDEIPGMENAVRLVLSIMAPRAKNRLGLNLFCGSSVSVSDDGDALELDWCDGSENREYGVILEDPYEFDRHDSSESRGYNRIFNHPLDLGGAQDFGLSGEERLTLVQLASEYMNVRAFDGEVEYSIRFENGVQAEEEPRASYRGLSERGNLIHWSFDPSLFIGSLSQIKLSFFKNTMKELAKTYPGKEFVFCYQPDYNYSETYTYTSKDGGSVDSKVKKMKIAI